MENNHFCQFEWKFRSPPPKKRNQKTENFEIQLYRCWGYNNITGQSNNSSKDQDKPNRISDWASMHACSTLDQHFHWFLLFLKEAANVSNNPPKQSNINQNNVTLVKQFKILNFPKNRQINNQFHLDFFTKQAQLASCICIWMILKVRTTKLFRC